jgi:DNA-binding XRE family transcriptional regulator
VTADDLRQWMHDHGLSQRQLAKSLGASKSSIERWLSTEHVPPRIALALDGLHLLAAGRLGFVLMCPYCGGDVTGGHLSDCELIAAACTAGKASK